MGTHPIFESDFDCLTGFRMYHQTMQQDMQVGEQEKAARSVFVGNIPYEATEEQLKAIFTEIGVVMSFRLVYDRETGKPKGYGFCEYSDQETAMSAMRNLNARELHGRNLRVDHATRDHGVDPKASATRSGTLGPGGPVAPPVETPFGGNTDPGETPGAICKAVASLPPEQMYALMKEMKEVIMNNPVEARNMLLKNPQLAYALLQAQVVMRIVNPDTARRMLHPKSGPARPAYRSAPAPQQQEARFDERQPPAYPSSYNQPPAAAVQRDPRSAPAPAQAPAPSGGGAAGGGDDKEKQQLIEQVLRLTPEQINQLPADQKQTIL